MTRATWQRSPRSRAPRRRSHHKTLERAAAGAPCDLCDRSPTTNTRISARAAALAVRGAIGLAVDIFSYPELSLRQALF
ncbi:MAG: hypothetical protein M0Z82_05645 [Actinomycetota bacterium]|nr:hypothetical protein [Actinomycetota bacterium]